MDYYVELADRPDIEEALGPLEARGFELTQTASAPQRRAEIIGAFYRYPDAVSEVWKKLRYGSDYRAELAEEIASVFEGPAVHLRWGRGAALDRILSTQGSAHATAVRFRTATAGEREGILMEMRAELASRTLIDELLKHARQRPFRPCLLESIAMAEGKKTDTDVESRIAELFTLERRQVRELAAKLDIPVPFASVLEQEIESIAARRRLRGQECPVPEPGQPPYRTALGMDLVGVTFSGGGIRSATFNLGVLQSLSCYGILDKCDYLSTVSGGGYIGGWFSAWTKRLGKETGPHRGVQEVMDRLSPGRSPNPMDSRIRPLRYLREFSNYLTPEAGFFSADTWTMIAIYSRNFLLNHIVLLLLLAALLILPRMAYVVNRWLLHADWQAVTLLAGIPLATAILALGKNLRIMDSDLRQQHESLRSRRARVEQTSSRLSRLVGTQAGVQVLVVLPLMLVSLVLATCYWHLIHECETVERWPWWLQSIGTRLPGGLTLNSVDGRILAGSFLFGGMFLIYVAFVQFQGRFRRCWPPEERNLHGTASCVLAALGAAAAGGGLAWTLGKLFAAFGNGDDALWHVLSFGPPLLALTFAMVVVVQVGLLGARFPDERREWWARMRAWGMIYSIGWMGLFAVAIYMPLAWYTLFRSATVAKTAPTILVWLATSLFGVQRSQTAADDFKREREGRSSGSFVTRLAVNVAPYVFIAGWLVFVSVGVHYFLQPDGYASADHWQQIEGSLTGARLGLTFALCAGISLLLAWRIGVNEFSMHHFYKNRLVRCYLGASRWRERRANNFTGFDPSDDIPLQELAKDYAGPYNIINCALNLIKGDDLAWQERKASSFVFTPHYCGYDVDRAVLDGKRHGAHADAYVPTSSFAYPGGPGIGTAIGISGAAASPSMGKATTTASAFLMSVFNVRLGWWLGNPRHRGPYWKTSGPLFGLTYTLVELFGLTNDERTYVNVSDGGHFENLGVYELVRRGCRYIIACDAGQDGAFVLEDLGNVIRKCRTDFGVDIEIAVDQIRDRNDAGWSNSHCVVGKIHYPGMKEETGYLLYLKPTITGDEPYDVLEYYKRVPEFPHESTADQWFNESQFESYRGLGLHIAEQAFCRYRSPNSSESVKDLFERLHDYWYPPVKTPSEASTRHAEEYSRLLDKIRENPGLKLDPALFRNWPTPAIDLDERNQFYVCNALIQLIENVYADVNLEHDWDHPHVQGWMTVFRDWAASEPFERTWRISRTTYATRFQNFYEQRLRPQRRVAGAS